MVPYNEGSFYGQESNGDVTRDLYLSSPPIEPSLNGILAHPKNSKVLGPGFEPASVCLFVYWFDFLTSRGATTKVKDRPRSATLILSCIMRGATILASFNARVLLRACKRAMGILHGTTILAPLTPPIEQRSQDFCTPEKSYCFGRI